MTAPREIDLRSDTVTLPTPPMLSAMSSADLGDDLLREDPTVKRLERLAADTVGKEDALLVPSGTMGNLVALMTHAPPGMEVLTEYRSHIMIGEGGGIARIAGLLPRAYEAPGNILPVDDIERLITPPGSHFDSHTALLCLENTHNSHGGIPIAAEQIAAAGRLADQHHLKLHIDGARIFNAACALDVSVRELVSPADSVMFCLSKGLCAPVGSLVAGTAEFVSRARRTRQILGGGMRQAGVLAAAGIVALTTMVARLSEDHALAQELAEGLSAVPGVRILNAPPLTNMVYVVMVNGKPTASEIVVELRERGVAVLALRDTIRLVTHHGVSSQDVRHVCKAFADVTDSVGSA